MVMAYATWQGTSGNGAGTGMRRRRTRLAAPTWAALTRAGRHPAPPGCSAADGGTIMRAIPGRRPASVITLTVTPLIMVFGACVGFEATRQQLAISSQ